MRSNRIVAATAVASLGLAAVAVAADREATVSAATPVYTWDAGPHSTPGTPAGNPFQEAGQECSQAMPCDFTLIKADAAGTLEVVTDGDDGANANAGPDIDLYLYDSDASGTQGKLLKASESPEADEKVTQKINGPGYYLIRNLWWGGVDVAMTGTVTLKPAAPAGTAPSSPGTPGTTPGTTPAPPPAAPAKLTAVASLGGVKLSKVGKTGFAVKISCNAACKGSFALALSKRDAKKLKIKGGKLGKGSFDHSGDKTFTVKVSKSVAKRLKKAKSATVELKGAATDASGGQQTALAAKAKYKK